jgi:hypothetical protein
MAEKVLLSNNYVMKVLTSHLGGGEGGVGHLIDTRIILAKTTS